MPERKDASRTQGEAGHAIRGRGVDALFIEALVGFGQSAGNVGRQRGQAQDAHRIQRGMVLGSEADDPHVAAPQPGLAMQEPHPANAGLGQRLDLRCVELDLRPGCSSERTDLSTSNGTRSSSVPWKVMRTRSESVHTVISTASLREFEKRESGLECFHDFTFKSEPKAETMKPINPTATQETNRRPSRIAKSSIRHRVRHATAAGCYGPRFTARKITNSRTAPTVAHTKLPIRSPADTPSSPNTKPPNIAPMTPTMRSPISPNPPPLTNCPASQPAQIPMSRNQTMPITRSH